MRGAPSGPTSHLLHCRTILAASFLLHGCGPASVESPQTFRNAPLSHESAPSRGVSPKEAIRLPRLLNHPGVRAPRPEPTTPASLNDASVTGTWFIDRDRARFSLDVAVDEKTHELTGRLVNEKTSDLIVSVDGLTWNAEKSELRFHAADAAGGAFYIVQISDGVMSGRYALAADDGPVPSSWEAYSGHLTGWRSASFDADIVPRTFDIVIAGEQLAKLRIDRAADDSPDFIGELKVYASRSREGADEIPAAHIAVSKWDGEHLAFALPTDSGRRLFSGTVTGRTISGSVVSDDSMPAASFEGVRADLFAYGLSARMPDERAEWQRHTRERMFHLMMAGN